MSQLIYLGSDHAGYELKDHLISFIKSKLWNFQDEGCFNCETTDYPISAHKVAEKIIQNPNNIGVLICGSGNGMAMSANKHAHIRAALCWNETLSELARAHNNANILCLPARFINVELAEKILDKFMMTPFEGGRHLRRVENINLISK